MKHSMTDMGKASISRRPVMMGIPLDDNSSFLKGCARAPAKIREVMHNGSSNFFTELGVNLADQNLFFDGGDFKLEGGLKGFQELENRVDRFIKEGARLLSVGGDHSITYPIMKGFARNYQEITVLHFDAHSDTYDNFEGNRYSHACPFARIMEENLVKRLIQVGVRTLTDHQKAQIARFGIEVVEARNFNPALDLDLTGPLYISLDLDVLDPACAPGVSHHEPGGLMTRDLINLIHRIEVPLVGADVVEYNPQRDLSDMTAMVATRLIKELAGKMTCWI